MEKSTTDTYIQVDDEESERGSVVKRVSSTFDCSETDSSAVDAMEISMQDACDSLDQDRKIGRALIRLVSTVIFCCFAATALSRRPRTTLQWDQVLAVMNAIATDGENVVTDGTPLHFYNIGGIDDAYSWLTDTLVPSVFVTEDVNGDLLPEDQRGRVAISNQVLGGVVIDVTRKATGACNVHDVITELYPNCTDADNTTLERTFLNINLNATEAVQAIEALKTSDKGIDNYTKKLLVTIATYNGDFEGYSVTTLEVDFQESGLVKPTSATNAARATPYQLKNALADAAYGSTYVIWLVVILYWGTGRRPERRKSSKLLGSKCGLLRRFMRTLLKIVAIGGSVPVFAAIWAVIELKMNTSEFHSNLLKLADSGANDADTLAALLPVVDLLNSITTWTYVLAMFGAILAIQLGLYLLFQLSFHPRLSIFTRTMSSALRQFAAFFVVWLIAFMIFVCVGSILFGSDVEEFSSRLLTTQACINMLFGTFDYDSIKDLQFAYIYYWSFMIVVSLVLLNLMLAIVLDAYTAVREESYKGEANLMLNGRIQEFILDKLHGKKFSRCAVANSKPSHEDAEAKLVFERINADIRKLPNEFVVLRGKVNSALLLQVLQVKMEMEYLASGRQTKSPTKLTAETLRETFPAAKLTDNQLRTTFRYLHEGVVINKSAIKKAQKKDEADRAQEQRSSDVCVRPEDSERPLRTDSTRLAALERKMDQLLTEVLATQAAIRDARFA